MFHHCRVAIFPASFNRYTFQDFSLLSINFLVNICCNNNCKTLVAYKSKYFPLSQVWKSAGGWKGFCQDQLQVWLRFLSHAFSHADNWCTLLSRLLTGSEEAMPNQVRHLKPLLPLCLITFHWLKQVIQPISTSVEWGSLLCLLY